MRAHMFFTASKTINKRKRAKLKPRGITQKGLKKKIIF